MTRDPALRWLLDNDPEAGKATSTYAYLRQLGAGDPIGRYKTEFVTPDHNLERRDHCTRCTATRNAEAHRVA